jgi:septal ring factor EnvC (AmiA/AmiB activator)
MRIWIGIGALAFASALAAQPDPRGRLASARAEADQARQRAAAFEARARASADAAERARAEQAALAARIQSSEAEIAVAEARLLAIEQIRRAQERRLAARRQPIVKLVAALQTMARRPAGATLVQPGSISDMARLRAMLATMGPQIDTRTQALRTEVERARQMRLAAAKAVGEGRQAQQRLRQDQMQLARLESEQRRRATQFASSARLEGARAAEIADGSRDLEGLVRQLDADAALRDRLAALPGPRPRPVRLGADLPVEQAVATAPLRVRLPVIGPVLRGFGETLPSGQKSRGLLIGSRRGGLVVAPAAGRVTFAGLFRGYGAIAILDHGGGYTSLITGLESNQARVGDRVQQGSPVGRSGANGVGVELRRQGQPVDLSQFVA